MARRLYIAGTDRYSDLIANTLQAEQILTQAVDSCSFRVRGDQPEEGREVRVEDDALGRLFGGIIDKVQFVDYSPDKTTKVWQVDCQDWTYQLDRKLVVETYQNMAADLIAKDIITKYGGGIFTTNHVQTGAPVVEYIVFDYKRPSECLKELAEYVAWDWFVDYNKDIWFFDPKAQNQPAPISLEPGGYFRNVKHSIETTGLRNRVYVRGGTMLSDPWTYEVKADGAARAWALPHKPHDISLTVGGVAKTVGVENLHNEADYNYMMNFQEKYVRASAQTATPAAGTTLAFAYKYDIDVITMVEDIASQQAIAAVQGGDGVYEHSIVDDSLTTIDAAEAAGLADLREHANPRVKGSFETEVPGWTPGQLVTINLPDRGITGTFLVQKVTITPATPELWTYRVEYGGRLLGIADWLQALWKAQQKKKLNETALLHKFAYGAETAKVTDEVQGTLKTPPWKVEQGYESLLDIVMPGDPTFTRNSVAYKQDGTQLAINQPRFETGKFNQAVMVEEGTTNVVADSSFENADITLNWNAASVSAWAFTGTARVRDTTYKKYSTASVKCGDGAAAGKGIAEKNQGTAARSVSAGQVWTLSFDVYATNAATQYIALIRCYDSAGTNVSGTITPPSGWAYSSWYAALCFYATVPGANAWYRITKLFTVPTGVAHVAISLQYYTGGDYYVWFDGVQFENKAYATSFIDGTRSSETLTIPTAGVLSPTEGTVECWVYIDTSGVHSANNPNWSFILSVVTIRSSPSYAELNQISIRRSPSSTNWSAWFSNSSGQASSALLGSITVSGWYSIAVTWKQGVGGYAYLNGVLKGSVSSVYLPSSFASVMGIGVWNAAGGNYNLNSYIDDFRVSNCAMTDAEIAVAYQSGQPLPVDADTVYKLSLDGNLTPQKQALSSKLQAIGSNLNVLQLDNLLWAQLQYVTSSDGITWSAWQNVDPAQNKLIAATHPGYYKVKANRSAKVAVKNWKKPFDQTDVVCGFVMAAS